MPSAPTNTSPSNATDAGVDTLVLTHILPYRDLEYMREAARDAFDGEVVVGRDLLTLQI